MQEGCGLLLGGVTSPNDPGTVRHTFTGSNWGSPLAFSLAPVIPTPPGSFDPMLPSQLCTSLGFPGSASGKEPTCTHGFDPWVGKSPWRRAWQPTPVFLPVESPGQRSWAGYSPWGRRVRHDFLFHFLSTAHLQSELREHLVFPVCLAQDARREWQTLTLTLGAPGAAGL